MSTPVPPGDTDSSTGAADVKRGRLKGTVVRNALSNWVGFAADAAVGFILSPFLIRQLGESGYGIWILIGALAGYLGMLDFGIRGSVGRYIAYHTGRSDDEGILATLNTALFALCGIGLAAFALVLAVVPGLERLFAISGEQLAEARMAFIIVGVQLAMSLPLSTFGGILWGRERFDLINLVDTAVALFRGVGMALVVWAGPGLVGLAWMALAVTLLDGLAKALLCRVFASPFRFSWRHVRRATFQEIGPYGFWNFLVSISAIGRQHLTPLVVRAGVGVAAVTPYSIGARLAALGNQVLVTTVNVLVPTLTTLVGQGDSQRQNAIILRAGRFCAAYSLYSVALLVLLSRSLIGLWIEPKYSWAWSIVAILAVGEWLPMSVHPYNFAVLAMAKQRPVAWRGAAECGLGIALALALGPWLGLEGIAVGFAVAAAWMRGVFMLSYGGSLIGVTPRMYLRDTIAPVLLHGALPVAGLAALVYWRQPAGWLELISFGAAFSLVYAAFMVRCVPDLAFLRPAGFLQVVKSIFRPA